MPDVFISHTLEHRDDVALLCQYLEEFGLAVVDEELDTLGWRDRVARRICKTRAVVIFGTRADTGIAHEICAAAETNGKALFAIYEAQAVDPAQFQIEDNRTIAYDRSSAGALRWLAEKIEAELECSERWRDRAHSLDEEALDPITDRRRDAPWNLSFWLRAASLAPITNSHSSNETADPAEGETIDSIAPPIKRQDPILQVAPHSENTRAHPRILLPDTIQKALAEKAKQILPHYGRYVIKTRADSPELCKAAIAIEQAAWASLRFLRFTRAHLAHYRNLLEAYADWQLCLVDEATGYPVAVGSCVPLACDFNNLPPEGWDWIVEKAADDMKRKAPNALGALAIAVPRIHHGNGFVQRMIEAMRTLAGQRGLDGVIAPVRPAAKQGYPFVSLSEYVSWIDLNGRVFDPSLRAHLGAGGKMLNSAERSAIVDEPIGLWESWAGTTFDRSDDYALDGAIAPVHIDIEHGTGRYVEPSIWFAYSGGG